MEELYHKLVRDKIPEIIQKDGKTPVSHIADDEEYALKLRQKLREEIEEFLEDANPEELADILEVLYAIADTMQVSIVELEQIRIAKEKERGGFKKRIVLESVSD